MIHFINVVAFWYYVKYLAGINWYFIFLGYVVVVQWLSRVWLFVTPWTVACQLPCPSPSPSRSLLKFMFIESVMPYNHLIPFSCLQSFPALGSFLTSQLFMSGGQSTRASAWVFPKNILDWFPIRLTGLISLLSTGLSSLLQHHSSKASILQHSTFFMVQLSHPYMNTGKTKTLTRWTFVGKVMSLLSNMLSRFVIAFLPKSKLLLIWWLQSPSEVIVEPKKRKSVIVSIVSPSIFHEVMGPVAMN